MLTVYSSNVVPKEVPQLAPGKNFFLKQFYCKFWFFKKKFLSIYPKLILDIYPYTLHRYPAVCLHLFWWLLYVFWRCTWGTLNEGDEIVSISSKLVRRMTRVDCVKALKGKPNVIFLVRVIIYFVQFIFRFRCLDALQDSPYFF